MNFSFIETVKIVIGEFTRIKKTEILFSSDVMWSKFSENDPGTLLYHMMIVAINAELEVSQ